MSEGGKGAKVSQPSRSTDKIGAFAGVSGRTVEKIAAVVEATDEDPQRFGHLVEIARALRDAVRNAEWRISAAPRRKQ